jgi:patatin-like phospholipase/acyl hydrolase|tara:strand:+ start:3212 stop:4213 length:1002 start_codon:yes stop_codon:yes gene_type:complete
MSRTRILSIDGGGIKGIVPAVVLLHLEKLLQNLSSNPNSGIHDYFDLFSGASTGAIIIAGLLSPDTNNRPKYSSKEILDLYLENGQIIFKSSLFQEIKSVSGIVNVKYDSEGLESVFEKYFGKSELKDLLKPSLIPVYDLSRGKNYFFRQQKALISPRHNFYVKDLLRGATSALTYFPPAQISTVNDQKHHCFIDGGVFANNPALSAYAEFRYHNSDFHAKDTMMLSLGTGRKTTNLDCEVTANWGAAEWLYQGSYLTSNAVSSASDYQLNAVYDNNPNYLRLDSSFDDNQSSSMDNTDKGYLDYLISLGETIVRDKQSEINAFAEELISNSN